MKHLKSFLDNDDNIDSILIEKINFIRDTFIELEDSKIVAKYTIEEIITESSTLSIVYFRPKTTDEYKFRIFIEQSILKLRSHSMVWKDCYFLIELKMPNIKYNGNEYLNDTTLLSNIIMCVDRLKSEFENVYINFDYKGTGFKPINIIIPF